VYLNVDFPTLQVQVFRVALEVEKTSCALACLLDLAKKITVAEAKPPFPALHPLSDDNMDTNPPSKGTADGHQPSKKKKTASGQNADASKETTTKQQQRRKQPVSSNPTDQLLKNNPFSALPVGEDIGPVEKRVKVPPLFTASIEVSAMRSELAKHQIFPIFKLVSSGTKILCSTLDDFRKVGEFLRVNRQQFYTHDVPGNKPLKVVIRGLPSLLVAEVKTELQQLKLNPIEVYAITRKDQSEEYRDKLFLVHFEKGSTTIAALRQIRAINQIGVHWEQYRPRHRDVTQCQRCMAFGHGTKNCFMNPRCGKCSGAHATTECNGETEEPKCVNCGLNHHGNDRNCPKRAEFMKLRREAATRHQPSRKFKPPPAITEKEFPPIVRRPIPVLEPLPLQGQHSSKNRGMPPTAKHSVQPRLAAAAQSTTPPGLSYAGVTAGFSADSAHDETPFSTDELVQIISAAFEIKRKYTTRSQQLAAIIALINGP
jgi:hypothetical protein